VNDAARELPAEWDATIYHRVSTPMVALGQPVLDRLPLAGTETVVDAGCGTGLLTGELLERLPHGRVVAVDRSANMLAEASAHLTPRFGDRVSFIQADVQDLSLPEPVDIFFSTATFHWVLDHPRLFQTLFTSLKPGGRLIAQCGGGPNIAQFRERAEALLDSPRYREEARGWRSPWEFASAEVTARRLADAGFEEVETWLEPRPVRFDEAEAFREFVTSVVLRAHLDAIDNPASRLALVDELTAMAAKDDPPFLLDYWRLNISAQRPLDA
jgi:trans-aconitate methyltransferase